jgi:pimeloyl-ACP methyl ester carboxylesterase
LTPPDPESTHRGLAPGRPVGHHLQIAKLAAQTYEPSVDVTHKYDSQCFGEFGSLDRKQFAGFAMMGANRHAVIAFRGTKGLHNWKVDSQIGWTGTPPRHRGFDSAWRSMEPAVRAWLKQHQPLSITLTGHSLGGAIATLAALDLAKGWPIDEVVVFGCPRVGPAEFAKAYSAAPRSSDGSTIDLRPITMRYIKTTDLVPRLPWEFLGYGHVGDCFYFNRQGEEIKSPPSLLGRVYAVSDLEEREQPNYRGVLDRLGIDLTPKTAPSPVRLYGTLDLLTRVLPGWVAMLSVVIVVLLVDGFRHPMKGYVAILERQLKRSGKQSP